MLQREQLHDSSRISNNNFLLLPMTTWHNSHAFVICSADLWIINSIQLQLQHGLIASSAIFDLKKSDEKFSFFSKLFSKENSPFIFNQRKGNPV
jgi:hypothetical protein